MAGNSFGVVDVRWSWQSATGCERPALVTCGNRLTPYCVETIVEDALRAGPGAQFEVTLAPGAPGNALRALLALAGLARVARRGVHIRLRRAESAAA